MAGRKFQDIINLIIDASRKPLSGEDLRAAEKAATSIAGPVTTKSLKAGQTISIPKIPPSAITKSLLDPVGYSDVKLSRPIESYAPTTVTSNTPLAPQKTFSLQDLVNSYITPAYWDRMAAGQTLTGVGSVPLQRGYELPGGIDFMRGPAAQADDAMTASAAHIISGYANKAEKAAREGRDLNLVPLTMPPDALDFQGTTSRVAADLLQQTEPLKRTVRTFDEEMRSKVPEFPGLMSPDLDQFLAGTSPDNRKAFIRTVGSESAAKMGLQTDPAGAARYAITDPTQRLAMPGFGGYGVARLSPGESAIISNPQFPHSDFDTQMKGEYRGRLELPQHQSLLFPTSFAQYATQKNKLGKPLTESNKSYALSRQQPMELVTTEMADLYDQAVLYAKQLGLIP